MISEMTAVISEALLLADLAVADRARQLQADARQVLEGHAMDAAMALCAAARRGDNVEPNLQSATIKAVQLNQENGARVLEEVNQVRPAHPKQRE